MRFKTDENLPEEFAEVLRAAGWDDCRRLSRRIACAGCAGCRFPDVLLGQRGDIDCGGMEYVIIATNLLRIRTATPEGHISVGVQPGAQIAAVVSEIRDPSERKMSA